MAMRQRVNYALAGVVIFLDAKPVFLSDIGKANEAVVIMNVFIHRVDIKIILHKYYNNEMYIEISSLKLISVSENKRLKSNLQMININ